MRILLGGPGDSESLEILEFLNDKKEEIYNLVVTTVIFYILFQAGTVYIKSCPFQEVSGPSKSMISI
jgi:hypothetical protein